MPNVEVQLTSRDRSILSTLAEKVRVLTIDQVARTWWSESSDRRALASRRLLSLVRAGHLECVERLTGPASVPSGPLAQWRPGRPPPELASISTFARRRSRVQVRMTRLFSAAHATAIRLAGTPIRPIRSSETTHDVQLASVYLWLLENQPRRAAQWVAEWTVPELTRSPRDRADKLPDALVMAKSRITAIEYVGSYSTRKLGAFHAYCAERHYTYELW